MDICPQRHLHQKNENFPMTHTTLYCSDTVVYLKADHTEAVPNEAGVTMTDPEDTLDAASAARIERKKAKKARRKARKKERKKAKDTGVTAATGVIGGNDKVLYHIIERITALEMMNHKLINIMKRQQQNINRLEGGGWNMVQESGAAAAVAVAEPRDQSNSHVEQIMNITNRTREDAIHALHMAMNFATRSQTSPNLVKIAINILIDQIPHHGGDGCGAVWPDGQRHPPHASRIGYEGGFGPRHAPQPDWSRLAGGGGGGDGGGGGGGGGDGYGVVDDDVDID